MGPTFRQLHNTGSLTIISHDMLIKQGTAQSETPSTPPPSGSTRKANPLP